MDNWETMMVKREIFDLFDYARILYNDFYRKDGNFNETDTKAIKNIIKTIEKDINEIKEEMI